MRHNDILFFNCQDIYTMFQYATGIIENTTFAPAMNFDNSLKIVKAIFLNLVRCNNHIVIMIL